MSKELMRNFDVVKIKQSRRKHSSGCRMFEVNGCLGVDVIHVQYKGKTICRLDINNDGTIDIFSGYKTKVELDVSSLGFSNYFVNCEDMGDWKMSKELDALKRFNGDVVVYNEYLYYDRNLIDYELYQKNLEIIDKDFNLLKQALKRNEPMKVDLETVEYIYYNCPKCGKKLVKRYHIYCFACGQKLDWSDDE